jgi:N-methylhydantoinase A
MSQLITIDNGGTLTDVCVIDGERVTYTKTLTTPHDLSRCLFDGLERVAGRLEPSLSLGGLLRSADNIRYSTTLGTNAPVPAWPHGPSPAISTWIGGSEPVDGTDAPWGLVRTFTADPHGTVGAPRFMVVPRDTDPDAVAAAVRSWRGQ